MAKKVVAKKAIVQRAAAKKAVKAAAGKQSSASKGRRPAASKAAVKKAAKRVAVAGSESLTHRLDALLHTMRCIAQHEDELCTLLHDARRTGRISGPLRKELRTILEELPAEDYAHDLQALQQELKAA